LHNVAPSVHPPAILKGILSVIGDFTSVRNLRQQPSKVPIMLSSSKIAGSSPNAHHHLSLTAAQRTATGDARLISRMDHENNRTEGAQTEVNV
jgi:hypothetical protein